MNAAKAWFRVALPPCVGGSAIGVIELCAADADAMDRALAAIDVGAVTVGASVLRRIAGVDGGVVARPSATTAMLMPHGSQPVMQRIAERLVSAGVREGSGREIDTRACFPEAADQFEVLMLETLARAASPLVVDALLGQPIAWRRARAADDGATRERSRRLMRLVEPATVVAIGSSNVGKSTLLNALARRQVAVVSPREGTTRDHVGAHIDLGGLVVHWFDTPGLRSASAPDAIEQQAFAIARERVAAADLIVLCGDLAHGFADPGSWGVRGDQVILRCGTRCDLGAPDGAEVATAAGAGWGLEALGESVREALVPKELISDPRAWHFHPRLIENGVAEAGSGRYC